MIPFHPREWFSNDPKNVGKCGSQQKIPCPPREWLSNDPKNVWNVGKCGSQQMIPCLPQEWFSNDPKNLWNVGKCGSQQMYPHEQYDFPEWFSNDPKNKWKSGSWEEYTDAADQLKVVKSDEGGFYYLQKREDSSVFTSCHEDLVRSEFRLSKGCNKEFVIPYAKITKTDLKNFRLLLAEAEKDFQLFEVYFSPDGEGAMLQHNSTVENVVARLPLRYLNNTERPSFRRLLERLIYLAKRQREKELYRDYTLFLPNCDRIKSCTTIEECLGMLKDDPHFVAKKLGDVESFLLKRGMRMYLNCRDAYGDNISNYNARMEQDYQCQRDTMWKARSRLPGELMSPIHFLAFQKRHKGYNVRHPVKEIMKFRAYFGQFLDGVPPPWCPKPQS